MMRGMHKTLTHSLNRSLTHSPTSHRDAARIVKTITEAVKYLHDQGIVHRGKLQAVRISTSD